MKKGVQNMIVDQHSFSRAVFKVVLVGFKRHSRPQMKPFKRDEWSWLSMPPYRPAFRQTALEELVAETRKLVELAAWLGMMSNFLVLSGMPCTCAAMVPGK